MKNKREIQTVDRILKILNNESKWIKKYNAKDKDGNTVHPPDNNAICWCLEGALHKALSEQHLTNRKWQNSYYKIVNAICKSVNLKFDIDNPDEHIGFNDDEDTEYNDVINALKGAKDYLTNGISKTKG